MLEQPAAIKSEASKETRKVVLISCFIVVSCSQKETIVVSQRAGSTHYEFNSTPRRFYPGYLPKMP